MKRLPEAPPRPDGTSDLSYLRQLQTLGPLAADRYGIVLAFSMDHLQQILTSDHTRQPEVDVLALQGINSGPMYDFADKSLLYANGQRHRARRKPLARTFAHRMISALREDIRVCAERLIEPCIGKDDCDFIAAVAGPLPARIIASIIGAPEDDVPHFTRLVYSAIRAMSVRSPEIMAEAMVDMGRLTAYVNDLLAARRAAPQNDFLTQYIESVADSDLDADEIKMQIVALILAGADTTRLTLAMTVKQMIENPAEWCAFQADPRGRVVGAVAEGMRFEPVIGSLAQVAVDDFELDGFAIGKGTVLAPSLITALRDPKVYDDPDRFDISRDDHPRQHPIFGAGPHRCLGEALAYAELEEALVVLAESSPNPELLDRQPTLRGLGAVRGLEGPSDMKMRL